MPVLVVAEPQWNATGGIPGVSVRDDVLAMTVRNVGSGPALDVSATIHVAGKPRLGKPLLRPIAPGSLVVVTWDGGGYDATNRVDGWIDYGDVSEAAYRTMFGIPVSPGATSDLVVQRFVRLPPFIPRWMERAPKWLGRRYAKRKLGHMGVPKEASADSDESPGE